ncbi:MAG: hypothetical protein HY696_01690 [Deltaproteobacteria bacterium]|nr:hypothetical protein [Deltaproteobacteria bacterium]
MQKIIVTFFTFCCTLGVALPLTAKPYRIYCHPDGVSIEYRIDEQYTDENATISTTPWFLLDDTELPAHDYSEQLRCQGRQLVADRTIIPAWATQRQQADAATAELDAELAKSEPDVVTVLRLQRALEKMRTRIRE